MEENKSGENMPIKKKKFSFTKKNIQLIIAAVLGIIIIIIYFSTFSSNISKETNGTADLEKKLEQVLCKIKGAGKVSILLTYKDGGRTIYATDTIKTIETKTENGKTIQVENEKTTVVLVGGKPLIEQVLVPEIMGVIIVSEGAVNPSVRLELTRAAETLLNIKSDIIKVFSST